MTALKLHISVQKHSRRNKEDSSTALNHRGKDYLCWQWSWRPNIWPNFPQWSVISLLLRDMESEESCLVFVVNLSLCRTPQRGSSECSKLGIRTLWPQPAQRQIGLPVLYVKLPARKHRPAGYSATPATTPLLQPNCAGVPLSKLLCILGAQEMGRTLRMVGGWSWTFFRNPC